MEVSPYDALPGLNAYSIHQTVSADDLYSVIYEGDESQLLNLLEYIAHRGENAGREYGLMDMVVSVLSQECSSHVKVAVCQTVRGVGQCGHAYYLHVARLLGDENPDVKVQACLTLASIGRIAKPAESAIAGLLAHSDSVVRCAACAALGDIGATSQIVELSERLQDDSPEVQGAACIALGSFGEAGGTMAAEVAKYIENPRSRRQAIKALGEMRPLAKEHLESICRCLHDDDYEVRIEAAVAIGKKSKAVAESPVAFRSVVALLEHSDGRFRTSAAAAIGLMGRIAASEATALRPLLADSYEESSATALTLGGVRARVPAHMRKTRCAAAIALGLIGCSECVQDLGNLLTDDDWEVRLCACEALACLRGAAEPVAAQISKCLKDDKYAVRKEAAVAIGRIGDVTYVDSLVDAFDDTSPSVRVEVLGAIAQMGEEGQQHIEKVFCQTSANSSAVRAAAISCLGKMGEKGQLYAGVVAQRLSSQEDYTVKVAAIEALGHMGKRGTAYVQEVAACLHDQVPQIRAEAAATLRKMGAEAAPYLASMKALSNDTNAIVRESAVEVQQQLASSGRTSGEAE